MDAFLMPRRSKFALRSQRWRWVLIHRNGQHLAISSEGYANKQEALEIGLQVCTGAYKVTTVGWER